MDRKKVDLRKTGLLRYGTKDDPWACRNCGCKMVEITDSRYSGPGGTGPKLRKRKCRNCGEPMLTPTQEWVVPEGFKVVLVPEDEEEDEAA